MLIDVLKKIKFRSRVVWITKLRKVAKYFEIDMHHGPIETIRVLG